MTLHKPFFFFFLVFFCKLGGSPYRRAPYSWATWKLARSCRQPDAESGRGVGLARCSQVCETSLVAEENPRRDGSHWRFTVADLKWMFPNSMWVSFFSGLLTHRDLSQRPIWSETETGKHSNSLPRYLRLRERLKRLLPMLEMPHCAIASVLAEAYRKRPAAQRNDAVHVGPARRAMGPLFLDPPQDRPAHCISTHLRPPNYCTPYAKHDGMPVVVPASRPIWRSCSGPSRHPSTRTHLDRPFASSKVGITTAAQLCGDVWAELVHRKSLHSLTSWSIHYEGVHRSLGQLRRRCLQIAHDCVYGNTTHLACQQASYHGPDNTCLVSR
jgi:hypothetical protein